MFNFEDYYVGYTKKTKKKNRKRREKKLKQFAQMITNKQMVAEKWLLKLKNS